MFENKVKELFETTKKPPANAKSKSIPKQNAFTQAALKKSAVTRSGNDAMKFSTTGNAFVDQFGKTSAYKAIRKFSEIEQDAEILWGLNQLLSVMFIIYLRIITRVVAFADNTKTETSQKGAELKNEPIMRMLWLAVKAPATFKKNLPLFVAAGSWLDVFHMMQLDLVYNGWDKKVLDWEFMGKFILSGLENPNTTNLVKKYLPQIKAKSACKTLDAQADTLIGKYVCNLLFGEGETDLEKAGNYRKYRKLKTSGTAHEWQKLISQKKFDLLDFSKIPGRALSKHIVRTKFLFNHKLSEIYNQWAKKPETVTIKYTGFVHELFKDCASVVATDRKPEKYRTLSSIPEHEQITINKQFAELIRKGRGNEAEELVSYIVVRDTSNSMGSEAIGTGMSCYNVGKALALYFSEFLKGEFAGTWIEFNDMCSLHEWNGATPLEKWYNDHSHYVGSTNIISVVQMFVELKRGALGNPIAEADFPTGLLCISDGEFNSTGNVRSKTSHQLMLEILRKGGFSEEYVTNFKLIMWNLASNYYGPGTGQKFETFGGIPNVYYFSGYNGAIISFLNGKNEAVPVVTAEDVFLNSMNQEILELVEL